MESEISFKEKRGESDDAIIEIKALESKETKGKSADSQEKTSFESMDESSNGQMNLFTTNSSLTQPSQLTIPTQIPVLIPSPSVKPPEGRRKTLTRPAYSKPKSRIVEPHYPSNSNPKVASYSKPKSRIVEPHYPSNSNPKVASYSKPKSRIVEPHYPSNSNPKLASLPSSKANIDTPRTSAPITPRTPLMASVKDDDDDDDDGDEEVYKTENLKLDKVKRGKKVKAMVMIEWIAFGCIMAVLIVSLTVNKLKNFNIWSLELWKWCVLVLVIFCGRLFTEWLTNILVFLIEKNFLLKEKVLYFVFGMKKSIRVVIWLALILLAWSLLINRGVERSKEASEVLNHVTRGIVSTLVGAIMWMVKTLLIKLAASYFHVRTYFDRIRESIFHQYILQTLSGTPMVENDSFRISGQLCFNKTTTEKNAKPGEVINVDKLSKMKREKCSAWTMGGLIKVIRNSQLPTISDVLDDSVEEDYDEPKVITSEFEAKDAANKIFRNVAKHGHKYIEEDDLLLFMLKDEVDNVLPLFEGAAESRRIKKSSFTNWVVKAYNERKYLAASLHDAKTAIEELNKIASGLALMVIIIVWLLIMEITTTTVLVFISSQILLLVFMFGNTAKMVFDAIVFIFVVHPFDVGDRCVIDDVQMVVDEMNILSTIFLKSDNEKVYYPNSVLATKTISNFNRSPEMMGDTVEFAVDFSTSVESIAALKEKIKTYLESKPQHWSPNHSVQLKDIVDVNKMMMALHVTHTINFQNSGERGNQRSDLLYDLKKILEELGIKYRLPPQEVQISYVGAAMSMPLPPPSTVTS